ncbi:hypothetical protein I4U23_005749 [Adineta vaga]|nr:hypothetical protein I4U23_005749 [Adineta vaga]
MAKIKVIGIRYSWRTLFSIAIVFILYNVYTVLIKVVLKNKIACPNDNNLIHWSLTSQSDYVISTDDTLKKMGFKYVHFELTNEHIDVLHKHVPSAPPNDFRRLLERARAFGDGLRQLEALHIMKLCEFVGFTKIPHLPISSSFSDTDRFITTLVNLEKNLFPFLSRYYRSALHLKYSFSGRGIVLAVGNHHAQMAYASIRLLRSMNCNLPIEIFYNGEEDLNSKNRKQLEQLLSVESRNIQELIDDTFVKVTGWAIKPFAILFSRFAEVIFMDADVVFLQDPSSLFNHVGYQRARALFYYDRTVGEPNRETVAWLSSLFQKPWNKRLSHANRILANLSHDNQESGVIVLDKLARFSGLLVTCKLNSINERNSITYKFFYGDKETFWLGQEMVDDDYAFDPHLSGAIGIAAHNLNPKEKLATICGTQIVHFDTERKILWFNQFVLLDKYKSSTTLAHFEHYVQEPGIYSQKSDHIFCLHVTGQVFQLTANEKKLIATVISYWNEAKSLMKH